MQIYPLSPVLGMTDKLIILDRDGVINFDSPHYIKTPEEWIPIPGSLEAIGKLKNYGWTVTIATNQSGIGRGLMTFNDLFTIHTKMLNSIRQFGGEIDGIFFCPHHPDYNCECRKPKPKMLIDICKRFRFDTKDCIFVGDSLRDLLAAKFINAKSFLVLTGNGQKILDEHKTGLTSLPKNVEIFDDLLSVIKKIT